MPEDQSAQIPPGQCLPGRTCFRYKPFAVYQDGCVVATDRKEAARVVLQGFKDPRLLRLVRDAPVASRTLVMLVIQIACNGGQHLYNGDCKSAFLQGRKYGELAQDDNLTKLYLVSPKDPVSRKGVPEFVDSRGRSTLWELLGSVFGLADAPRRWFESADGFGVSAAPTSVGRVSFSVSTRGGGASDVAAYSVAVARVAGGSCITGGRRRACSLRISRRPTRRSAVGAARIAATD